jgi:hypothetical protein
MAGKARIRDISLLNSLRRQLAYPPPVTNKKNGQIQNRRKIDMYMFQASKISIMPLVSAWQAEGADFDLRATSGPQF